uniref:Cilia- and flagella-associated protein 157 n=1 Tax=Hanusia phi TaxID=3032 RepID=A0A7S0HPA5_9CRYP|mmetsp:Transcript_31208/g.70235  ORF Transcript_31208/g.70235 Transcript_31208/m.70235 type:complete len:329 (+) Transcript_31208:192-1178(+)
MPKKKQAELGSEVAQDDVLAKTDVSPPVTGDAAYIHAVRIKNLEERNEALKRQVEELERELAQKQEDELDICSHLQRDLAVKAERLAALELELHSVRSSWREDLIAKDAEIEQIRAQALAEREGIEEETKRTREELIDLSSFKENKALLENELIELRHEVSELKNRHDVEISDLKRDFDLKYAAIRVQCDKKIDETESSVEERAMQRVDDVTKKAIRLNKKRLILVENLQKEVDYLQSTIERMSKENKTLRTDLEIKEQEIHKLMEKMGQQRQFMNHQGRKLQDQANHESISRVEVDRHKQENTSLKVKIVELESRLNVQSRQLQHLQ